MKDQRHFERKSTEPAVVSRTAIADPAFKTVRMAASVAAVVKPIHWESLSIDCEEVEGRLASLNQRYETAADAAAQAGAEYRLMRGCGSRPTTAIEVQRRRWIQLEQWRRTVGAAIERLEDFA